MAVNTNTGVADLGQGMSKIDQDVLKIGQDVSKILENTDSQNKVVRDRCIFYGFSTCANCCLDCDQVSNLNYREIWA